MDSAVEQGVDRATRPHPHAAGAVEVLAVVFDQAGGRVAFDQGDHAGLHHLDVRYERAGCRNQHREQRRLRMSLDIVWWCGCLSHVHHGARGVLGRRLAAQCTAEGVGGSGRENRQGRDDSGGGDGGGAWMHRVSMDEGADGVLVGILLRVSCAGRNGADGTVSRHVEQVWSVAVRADGGGNPAPGSSHRRGRNGLSRVERSHARPIPSRTGFSEHFQAAYDAHPASHAATRPARVCIEHRGRLVVLTGERLLPPPEAPGRA